MQMNQQQIQELNQDMLKWGKSKAKQSKVKISAGGIEKALLAGKENYEQRQFDKDVVAFSYVVNSILYAGTVANSKSPVPIERLFEILDTRTYRPILARAQKNLATDEVPTDFFRDLYRRYLTWLENPKRKNKEPAKKNYGARSLENRWELEEFPKERWMK